MHHNMHIEQHVSRNTGYKHYLCACKSSVYASSLALASAGHAQAIQYVVDHKQSWQLSVSWNMLTRTKTTITQQLYNAHVQARIHRSEHKSTDTI